MVKYKCYNLIMNSLFKRLNMQLTGMLISFLFEYKLYIYTLSVNRDDYKILKQYFILVLLFEKSVNIFVLFLSLLLILVNGQF